MKRTAIAALVAAAALSGCMQTPKTAEEYIPWCSKRVAGWRSESLTELSQLMRVSRDKVPELFCKRVLAGVQQGRITGKDFMDAHRAGTPLWKVIKGQ